MISTKNRRIKDKKSQITVFIVIGLIIILSIGAIGYIKQIGSPSKQPSKIYEITKNAEPVKVYVETCIKDIGMEVINSTALQGGIDSEEATYLEGMKVSYWCIYEQDKGCVNKIITRNDIEAYISEQMSTKLDDCIDLGVFYDQGFEIKPETIKTNTKITDHKVIFKVNYPIEMKKEDILLKLDEFSAEITTPFGVLFKTSTNILNEEISEQYFDEIGFMREHADILVEKFRPYPDMVYRLSQEGTIFQFAINGRDTISEAGYAVYGNVEPTQGCCYNSYDSFCYQNSGKAACEEKQGIYSESCRCSAQDIYPKFSLDQTKRCKNTFDRLSLSTEKIDRKNGEAWCSYETQPGTGLDLVGSRNYVHYCIDGKEYVEPCRDYREEICVEKDDTYLDIETSTARCRPNRWYDCIGCEDEECCTDQSVRDCIWVGSEGKKKLETEKKCVPAVAPGLKFWEVNALSICTRANERKECNGLSCSQGWIDDTSRLCYMQADCGNFRNMKKVLTTYGFINTDMRKSPSSSIYDTESETKSNADAGKEIDKKDKGMSLSYDIEEISESGSYDGAYTYGEAIDANAEMISAGLNYLNDITSISLTDFINPFKGKSPVYILDLSICSAWQPPRTKQDCSFCTASPYRPCSEYLCRSLGQNCIFDYNNGNPECKPKKAEDTSPPNIELDKDALTKGFVAEEMIFKAEDKEIKGYNISPEIMPHQPFTLGISADRPVTCKLALTPFTKFNDLGSFYLGQQSFSTRQNLTLRTPASIKLPPQTMDLLNIQHYEEIAKVIEKPEEVISSYKEKYKTPIAIYNTFSGKDIEKDIDPIADMIKSYIEKFKMEMPYIKAIIKASLANIEEGRYMLFVRCMDESGNENTEPFFVELSISEMNEDKMPAQVIGMIPENNTFVKNDDAEKEFYIYLDEPGECRYDIEDKRFSLLNHTMACASGTYETSPQFGGTYECKGTLSIPGQDATAYIRCRDNPTKTSEYYFYIEESKANGIKDLAQDVFFNFTEPNRIYASLGMFEENHLTFLFNAAENPVIEMHLFKDTSTPCTISTGTYKDKIDICARTDDIQLGQYECINEIDLGTVNLEQAKIDINAEANTAVDAEADTEPKNIHNISITCADRIPLQQNTNEQSFVYTLKKSKGLEIIETMPKGEIRQDIAQLMAKTSESSGVKCRYKKEFSLSYKDMKFDPGEGYFTATISSLDQNLNVFEIRCTDGYENAADSKAEFYVIS